MNVVHACLYAVCMSLWVVRGRGVSVVFHDSGGDESFAQVVEALQHLDTVCTQVFDRVSMRVAEQRRHLANIKNVRGRACVGVPPCRRVCLFVQACGCRLRFLRAMLPLSACLDVCLPASLPALCGLLAVYEASLTWCFVSRPCECSVWPLRKPRSHIWPPTWRIGRRAWLRLPSTQAMKVCNDW